MALRFLRMTNYELYVERVKKNQQKKSHQLVIKGATSWLHEPKNEANKEGFKWKLADEVLIVKSLSEI